MRTDDVPNTVGQKDERGGGNALGVASHVAGGHLEGEYEGGDEGSRLVLLACWKEKIEKGGVYNIVAEKHAVLVFTPWKFPEKAYSENGGDEIDGHYDCADVLEPCCEVGA